MPGSRVPISKVFCGSCSWFPRPPIPLSGNIQRASGVFMEFGCREGVVGGVLHLPLAISKLKWSQAPCPGRSIPRMLDIEGDQYFSFRGIVISSYLAFSSSFWITNNPNKSIIRRSSIRGFRVFAPFSKVRRKVMTGSFLHLSDIINGVIS